MWDMLQLVLFGRAGRLLPQAAKLPKPPIMSKSTSRSKFVICVRTDDSEDLETRKVYEVLPDPKGARAGYLRIIDESGEDYLYPADRFTNAARPPDP